jgi:hypothetical protein
MITYGISTLGKPILTYEDYEDQFSFFRKTFIFITFLLMVLNIVFTIKNYLKFKNEKKL